MNQIKLITIIFALFFAPLLTTRANDNVKQYNIVVGESQAIRSDHLKMGGSNPKGEKIEVNNYFMSINGKPVIPIMGEFHYSRYPAKYWDESIKKMKAGGINVLASYVFWIMHEEKEGVFDWSGDKDLRKFIELCGQNNMKVVVRIGPFCHGEIRNGGLPDWLLGLPLTIRSNDTLYLRYVERLYNQIGKQLAGLMFKDGGPVFAIQLENEYQHSASPWGLTYPKQPDDWTAADQDRSITQAGVSTANVKNNFEEYGDQHMRILKTLAVKAGLIAPIYTTTGWGNAAVLKNESLPVTGAYPYPTWAPNGPSKLYLFKDLHKSPDYSPVRYVPEDYPNITAEIGGGIMVRYSRRPTVPEKSVDAIINRFLGSGSNGIGYYMYHGGSTPIGEKVMYSDEAYEYPKISYDFQAPIGEFGQIHPSFNRLKVMHSFIHAFENELAPMVYAGSENNDKISPTDIDDLRFAVRSNGKEGFVFMHNFQDHLKTKDIQGIQFKIKTQTGELLIPEKTSITLKSEENAILPFNINIGGAFINYATAQPLTRFINNNIQYYVFFAVNGIQPEFSIQKEKGLKVNKENCLMDENETRMLLTTSEKLPCQFSITKTDDSKTIVLIIDRAMAEQSWISEIAGSECLLFSSALCLQKGKTFEFTQLNNIFDLAIYPALKTKPSVNIGKLEEIPATGNKLLTQYRITIAEQKIQVTSNKISDNKLSIQLPSSKPEGVNDYFLNVNYTGDVAMAFINGQLVADDFYYGSQWAIGLKKFIDNTANKEMVLYFRPLYDKAPFYEDFEPSIIPDFSKSKTYLKINAINYTTEYKCSVQF